MERSPVFEQTYRRYLAKLAGLDLEARAPVLGGKSRKGGLAIQLFGEEHLVSPDKIADSSGNRPAHSVCVVLARYVIMCPASDPPAGDLVTYKDFKDAAPFVGGFVANCEGAVCRLFEGRLGDLERACDRLDARDPAMDVSYDLARRFEALPRVPFTMLFNDRDEELGASCTILFERRAELFLDMECLAILGWLLADRLGESIGAGSPTIM